MGNNSGWPNHSTNGVFMNLFRLFALSTLILTTLTHSTYSQAVDNEEKIETTYFRTYENHQGKAVIELTSVFTYPKQKSRMEILCKNGPAVKMLSQRSGSYLAKCPYEKLVINFGSNFESIHIKTERGEHSAIRVTPSTDCQMINGKNFCPGEVYTILFSRGLYRAETVSEFLLSDSGEIKAYRENSDLQFPERLTLSEPMNNDVKCSKSICIGDAILGDGILDYCKAFVAGFTSHGIVALGDYGSHGVLCPRPGRHGVFGAVTAREPVDNFESLIPRPCSEVSLTEKHTVYGQTAEAKIQKLMSTGGYDFVTQHQYCGPLGCDRPQWFKTTEAGSCKIFGYVRGFVRTPFRQ